ncbi:MAG: efflux RND transporter periplasmic adaptor subunit [Neisseriaceae bacterium]|nr:efflux RND transporter periplasmic adaptor subunit [Neisseriaceae bacterium]MBP6861792.1 efflux RND transporter periplasmic adaptor subunit [Neisseriaceae bacterium]
MVRPHVNKLLTVGLTTLALSIALTGCKKEEAPQAPPALPVTLLTVQAQDVPVQFEYVGQAAGSREVEVRARVGGILQKRLFTEGRPVKAGDVLFQLDPAPFKAAYDQANAAMAIEQAQLTRTKQDFDRIVPLYNEQAVSRKDYDDAKAAYGAAQASVAASRARLEEARINLGYTRVVAPISGVTSLEAVSEGSLITNTSAEGSLLTKISQLDPLYVNFSISEGDSLKLRQMFQSGQLTLINGNNYVATIRTGDGQIYEHEGIVSFTDNIVDTSSGSVKARAVFPNPVGDIMPGQFVRVILKGAERANVLTVPQKAVLSSQQGNTVWVMDKEGKAQPRQVVLGEESGDRVIVESGLNVGDQVVIDNLMKIRAPGTPIQNAPAKAAAPAPAAPAAEKAPDAEPAAAAQPAAE